MNHIALFVLNFEKVVTVIDSQEENWQGTLRQPSEDAGTFNCWTIVLLTLYHFLHSLMIAWNYPALNVISNWEKIWKDNVIQWFHHNCHVLIFLFAYHLSFFFSFQKKNTKWKQGPLLLTLHWMIFMIKLRQAWTVLKLAF